MPKGPSRFVPGQVQNPARFRGVLAPMAWVTCTAMMGTLMLKGTYRFWSKICCHPDDTFFSKVPAYSSRTICRPYRSVSLR